MAIPLLPLVLLAPGIAGAVALASTVKRIRDFRKLAGNSVAILGDRQVGKSSLLSALSRPAPSNVLPTLTDKGGGDFTLEIGGKMVRFQVPADLQSADPLKSPDWEHAIENANHVWYLFRADRVAQRDEHTLATIDMHLHFIKKWRSKVTPAQVMMIGTWADADPGWSEDPQRFIGRVSEAETIKLAGIALGKVPLVVGSLSTKESTQELERQLRKKIRR